MHTTKTLCNGRCDDGPIVIVQPDGLWYKHVDPSAARRLVAEHLEGGTPVHAQVLYVWGEPGLDDHPVPGVRLSAPAEAPARDKASVGP